MLLANFGFVTGGFAAAQAPLAFGLEPDSDTGVRGDDKTSLATATIVGIGQPGSLVSLNGSATPTKVQVNGLFGLFDIPLLIGLNQLSVAPNEPLGQSDVTTRPITRLGQEFDSPIVTIALASDTGRSNVDRITFDPELRATIADESGIGALELSIDGGDWLDVLPKLSGSTVSLDRADLELLLGAALTDGSHRVDLRATDRLANAAAPVRFSFVLDTTLPELPSVPVLSAATDTGVSDVDGLTNTASIVVETTSRLVTPPLC